MSAMAQNAIGSQGASRSGVFRFEWRAGDESDGRRDHCTHDRHGRQPAAWFAGPSRLWTGRLICPPPKAFRRLIYSDSTLPLETH